MCECLACWHNANKHRWHFRFGCDTNLWVCDYIQIEKPYGNGWDTAWHPYYKGFGGANYPVPARWQDNIMIRLFNREDVSSLEE